MHTKHRRTSIARLYSGKRAPDGEPVDYVSSREKSNQMRSNRDPLSEPRGPERSRNAKILTKRKMAQKLKDASHSPNRNGEDSPREMNKRKNCLTERSRRRQCVLTLHVIMSYGRVPF